MDLEGWKAPGRVRWIRIRFELLFSALVWWVEKNVQRSVKDWKRPMGIAGIASIFRHFMAFFKGDDPSIQTGSSPFPFRWSNYGGPKLQGHQTEAKRPNFRWWKPWCFSTGCHVYHRLGMVAYGKFIAPIYWWWWLGDGAFMALFYPHDLVIVDIIVVDSRFWSQESQDVRGIAPAVGRWHERWNWGHSCDCTVQHSELPHLCW